MTSRWRQLVAVVLLPLSHVVAMAGESVVTSGPIMFRVTVGVPQAFVAQPIEFRLQVDAPQGASVQLPELSGKLGPFEVRNFETKPEIPVSGGANIRRWMGSGTIESLKAGELSLPPLEIQVRPNREDSSTQTLRSNPVSLRIDSLVEDQTDATKFRDIKDVMDVSVPVEGRPAWTWWIGCGVASLLVAAAASVYFGRRRKEISAARWALMEIEQVEQLFGSERTNAVKSYERLADILGEYLQLRFSPHTSGRLRNGTADSREGRVPEITPETQREIDELLAVSDQVKFACLSISPEDVRRAMGQVRQLVEQCERVDRMQRMEPA